MVGIYRDRVSVDGSAAVPAQVYVISAATMLTRSGQWDTRGISVSFRPSTRLALTETARITWRGETYTVKGRPSPIMQAGRLHHWELTAEQIAPATD